MQYNQKRKAALKLLGNKCKRCGFSDKRALQIDHVYGDGAEERRQYGPRTIEVICEKIIGGEGNGRYQLLCANCNCIKRVENNEARSSTSNYMKMKNEAKKRGLLDDAVSVGNGVYRRRP
jgi:hypothetical protein